MRRLLQAALSTGGKGSQTDGGDQPTEAAAEGGSQQLTVSAEEVGDESGPVEWRDLSEENDLASDDEAALADTGTDIESDALLDSILDGLEAPTLVVDPAGSITHCNTQAVELFATERSEAIGCRPVELIEDDEGDVDLIGEAFDTGADIQQREQHVQIDGVSVPLSRTVTILTDADGNRLGALQTNREIAERVEQRRRKQALESYQEQVTDDLQENLRSLAEGDLTIDPEVPEPDHSFEAMEEVYEEYVELNNYLETTVANFQGVLDRLTSLADDLADNSDQLSANSEEVTSSIEQIDASSGQLADGTQDLAEQTDDLDRSVSAFSASIEEITASAQQIDATSAEAGDLAAKGVDDGEAAIEQIREANDAAAGITEEVTALESKMEEVENILEVIADIADETHLLALNANIEAARAGQDGSGFAVVAREVKQLAEESQASAEEIESIVADVQSQTDTLVDRIQTTNEEVAEGAEAVEDVVDRLTSIEAAVEQTSAGAAEVSDAVEDQARNVDEVSNVAEQAAAMSEELSASVQQISAGLADQSEAMEDVAHTAESLSTTSDDLHERIEQFRLEKDETATLDDVGETEVDADL